MRVFVAGASGVIGSRLVPLLVAAGHDVTAMTRSPGKVSDLAAAGATVVVCDVYDRDQLSADIAHAVPDVVVHQITDLPKAVAALPLKVRALNRARRRGTDNLIAAAQAAGVPHFVAQSTAFSVPTVAQRAVDYLEQAVLGIGGVVVRYGRFYGPGTWYRDAPNGVDVVHIDEAARRTVALLDAPSGVVDVLDPVRP